MKLWGKLAEVARKHEKSFSQRSILSSKRLFELVKQSCIGEKEVVPQEEIDAAARAPDGTFNGVKNKKNT